MRKGGFAAIGAIILGTAGTAAAQGIPVYDSPGYLPALATVKNTLSMIEPGQGQMAAAQQPHGSFNPGTDVNGYSPLLSNDAMSPILPSAARYRGTMVWAH